MAMGTRKWWIVHTAAGVAAVLLMVFGVSQCSNKNAERSENDDLKKSVVRAGAALDSARANVERVRNVNEYLVRDNRAKADTIKMQRDSIIVLNDSLDVVNKKLVDCRNSKKKKQVPVKTKPQPKPVVKPQPAKPQPKDTVVIVLDNTKKCNDGVRVELDNSKNSGNIVVSKNPSQATEVVLFIPELFGVFVVFLANEITLPPPKPSTFIVLLSPVTSRDGKKSIISQTALYKL